MKERKRKGYEQREADKKIKRAEEKREMGRKDRREANREDRRKRKQKRARNKEFARVTYVFVALFIAMMGYISYFNVVDGKEIIRSPYNKRQDSLADRVVRGQILDRNGNILAQTVVAEDGTESREYPYGSLFAHVVGYTAQGKTGIESLANFDLLTSNAFFLEKIKNEFQGQKNVGDNVVTTLDAGLQQTASDALGGHRGAVVVIEPSTGKILAMVSKPDYDPARVAEDWEYLTNDTENSVLLNRATQGQYAPGSTFKIVTALEYMRESGDADSYAYSCPGSITVADTTIQCYNGADHGDVSFRESIAYSCNGAFCEIGLGLDVASFRQTAKELLFDSKLPCDLVYNQSRFRLQEDALAGDRMMTAMGQGQTQVSPYHMALIMSAIANGGTLMKPYLVDSVTNYSGTAISRERPQKYKELMGSQEAAQLKDYMASVVDYGTGTVLSGQGYSAAGKTGTAEYSSSEEKDHSWFVGMANVDNPELVISVIIESSDGAASAVNIAKQVFDSYYY